MSANNSDSGSASSAKRIKISMRIKNCFWALNSLESFSSCEIALSRTVYIEISFGLTPKVGSFSSTLRAPVFQLVHSPGVRIVGTSSAFMRLKSQLLPKLFMMTFKAQALSLLIILANSSFDLVAFKTQMCSFCKGCNALTAILSDMLRMPNFFPKLIEISSSFTLRIRPTPHERWNTKFFASKAMCFSKSLIASKTFRQLCVKFEMRM